jgi:hypothetical protein
MDPVGVVVAIVGLAVSIVSIWRTDFYGRQACDLLREISSGLKATGRDHPPDSPIG